MNNETLQIIQTVALAFITGFFGWLSKDVVPMIKNKIDSQNNDKIVQYENMAFNFAKNIVVPLAINATLGDAEKRQLAAQRLSAKLDEVGIELPESTILAINERAYQAYKANGGDVHKHVVITDDNTDQVSTDDIQSSAVAQPVVAAQPVQQSVAPVVSSASVAPVQSAEPAQSSSAEPVQSAPFNPYANQTQGDVK